jgi:2-keto-4-pentenoate hydratase/2-oxohepta-3-ene-1,7-dioic acid hydratase in catechol pathway
MKGILSMKLALVRHDGRRAAGFVDTEAGTWQLIEGAQDLGPTGLAELIGRADLAGTPVIRKLDEVELLAPIPRPERNVICIGKNYFEHAEEFGRSGYDASAAPGATQPEKPIFFTKAPSAVVGPGAAIEAHADLTGELDYEAEVAIVLARGGRGIRPEDAYSHIGFYTAANDVTARDLQRAHRQWFLGKSLDGSCPLGPWLVSPDEIDVSNTAVSCYVNDELRQQAKLTELIFDIPTIIATLSAGLTLQPGDVILTGTPAGVGIGFTPPRFLVPGDTVRVEVSGVGALVNTVQL